MSHPVEQSDRVHVAGVHCHKCVTWGFCLWCPLIRPSSPLTDCRRPPAESPRPCLCHIVSTKLPLRPAHGAHAGSGWGTVPSVLSAPRNEGPPSSSPAATPPPRLRGCPQVPTQVRGPHKMGSRQGGSRVSEPPDQQAVCSWSSSVARMCRAQTFDTSRRLHERGRGAGWRLGC